MLTQVELETFMVQPPATTPPAAPVAAPPSKAFDYENHSTVVIQEVEEEELEHDTQHHGWMFVEDLDEL